MTARPVPAEMDAALLRDFGELTVQRVPVPQPGQGEVLCRVLACGICGTDLKIVAGYYRGTWPPSLPFIIGHEWSGEVAALGPGTERSGLAVGDRVVAENHTGCGACPMCRLCGALPRHVRLRHRRARVRTAGVGSGPARHQAPLHLPKWRPGTGSVPTATT